MLDKHGYRIKGLFYVWCTLSNIKQRDPPNLRSASVLRNHLKIPRDNTLPHDKNDKGVVLSM